MIQITQKIANRLNPMKFEKSAHNHFLNLQNNQALPISQQSPI